jgi:hypothetical protein
MKRYEYRIEYLKLETGTTNEDQLLDALNKWGRMVGLKSPLRRSKSQITYFMERRLESALGKRE